MKGLPSLPTVYVKWAYTDERGNVDTTDYEWFDTQKEAEDWIGVMKKKNGSYFEILKYRTHADFAGFVRMRQLETELEQLHEQF